jgi:hypothetical protein
LKDVFIDVNKLKQSNMKHHFVLEYSDKIPKKMMKNQKKLTNMYKICVLEGFCTFNCNLVDERILQKDRNKVVLTIDGDDKFIWVKDSLKIGLYFE